ncbi:hypothetical protein ACP275_10G048400 [Erythranthe tilingii]
MDHHQHHHNPPPPPPQPPLIRHTTTTQIFNHAASLFYSHLLTFLFLSFLLLTFHSNVNIAVNYISSLIDTDPSLKSLLSRIDLSDSPRLHPHHRHRRRRPFLQLSRVGTLDDEFFSGGSDFDRSLFHPSSRKSTPNATLLILSHFNSDCDFPKIVKPGVFSFKPEFDKKISLSEEDEIKLVETSLEDNESVVGLNFLMKGFELGHPEATSLFFLVGVFSLAYAYAVFAFIFTYTWVSGVIFLKVVDNLLGNYRSFLRTFWKGSNIGLRRLSGFILMKWAVRDALAELLGIYFLGEFEDQHILFKVFLKMKFIPFSNLSPWMKGHEWESAGFVAVWLLSDLIVGLIFAVGSCVAIVDSRRGGREIVREGYDMLAALFSPAFTIRFLEALVCGCLGRLMLQKVFGEGFTMFLQSLMEVYFMVAWLIFYFAARQKHGGSLGRSFGRREFEGLLNVAR